MWLRGARDPCCRHHPTTNHNQDTLTVIYNYAHRSALPDPKHITYSVPTNADTFPEPHTNAQPHLLTIAYHHYYTHTGTTNAIANTDLDPAALFAHTN